MSGMNGRQHAGASDIKATSGVQLYFSSPIITVTMYQLCSGQPLANTVTQLKLSLTSLYNSTMWQRVLIPAWQNYVSIRDDRAAWIKFYNVIHIHHGSFVHHQRDSDFPLRGYLSSLCRTLHWAHGRFIGVSFIWFPNFIAEVVFFSSTSRSQPELHCLIALMPHITLFTQNWFNCFFWQ